MIPCRCEIFNKQYKQKRKYGLIHCSNQPFRFSCVHLASGQPIIKSIQEFDFLLTSQRMINPKPKTWCSIDIPSTKVSSIYESYLHMKIGAVCPWASITAPNLKVSHFCDHKHIEHIFSNKILPCNKKIPPNYMFCLDFRVSLPPMIP